jgi:hypothetical protein
VIVKKRKNEKKRSFVFWSKAKKNEYNRSATIEDLPLLPQRDINEAVLHRDKGYQDSPVQQGAGANSDRCIRRPKSGAFRRGGTRAAPPAA